MTTSNYTIETAALGRPFKLGMLYDSRKEALIPGITLWDKDKLEQNTSVQQQNNTEFNVTTKDSIEEKSNLLKISGSLKVSLLGGLVDVGGSAKYFKDTKKSHKQARVTLQYQTTTKFETLTMSHLAQGQASHLNVFEDNVATHVVTAILYGAGAYFVFDQETSSEEERKQVEGELNVTCNKLKCLQIDAGASLSFNMDDQEKSAVEKFTCTFHGDFKLPSNPTSFNDAVRVYRELPNMLGENGELAVPLKVWLYPLCNLDSKAAKLQRHVSNELIKKSSRIIESLTTIEMRCSDILKETAATTFSAIAKKAQDLRQKCHNHKLNLIQRLGEELPAIRGGGEEEKVLVDFMETYFDNSPFNSKELDQWLTNKEKESKIVKSYLKQLQKLGVEMEDNLDDLLADIDVKYVVSFSFTSLDEPDSFLGTLSNYVKTSTTSAESSSSDLQAENKDWLCKEKLRVRQQMKLFGELKRMNTGDDTKFIVASKYDESHPGACIFIYEDGDDPVHFLPPSKPVTPTTTDVSFDSVTVHVSDPDSAIVEYRVEYREKQNQETEWKFRPVQKNQEAVHLSGLRPETEYEIRATAVGKLNYAVTSDACSVVTTIAVCPQTQQSVQIRSGCPGVYQLQAKKEVVGTLTRVTVGEKSVNSINKTIVLVGETGAGKSSLINALINYAMGVTWEHKVWYQIVQDENDENGNDDQSESQTSDVIVYEIFGIENQTLPYSLTLIDTPGLGDTRGTERDVIISQRLFELFQSEDGVHEVSAVGLVMKASDNRLTDRQMYIYNSLMSLFAKDMVENCVLLITHSNGLPPEVLLKAIEKADIKCARNANQPLNFLFDNCQHKERTEETDCTQKLAYELSAKGMKKFTDFLEKTQPQSLEETVKVLNASIRLAACVQNLQERIFLMERKRETVEQYQKGLMRYKQEMEENKHFTIEVEEEYKDKKKISGVHRFLSWLGVEATCCTFCEENCHIRCIDNLEKCKVLRGGNCSSCTNKCPLSKHLKSKSIYVTKTRKVQRTKEDMKLKYEKNKAEAEKSCSLMENLEKEKQDLEKGILRFLVEACRLVIKLDQISLNVKSFSTHVHLDFLIEKMEELGDKEKVEKLKGIRSKQDKKLQKALRYIFKATVQ